MSPEEGEEDDDFVMSGFVGSDTEEPTFYPFDDLDSEDSSNPTNSEPFEFRPNTHAPGLQDSQTSHDEEEESLDESLYPALSYSPQFDPETGWYNGSMEGLTALINNAGGNVLKSCSPVSPRTPDLHVVRPTSSGLPINTDALNDYLRRHQGTDVLDY